MAKYGRTSRTPQSALAAFGAAVVLIVAGVIGTVNPASAATPEWGASLISTVFNRSQPGASSPPTIRRLGVDSAGNQYISGYFVGTTVFGPGPGGTVAAVGTVPNVYVVSLTSGNDLRWVKRIGNGLNETFGDMAVSPAGTVAVTVTTYGAAHISTPYGDRVIPGHGSLDVLTAEFASKDGHILWARSDGGTGSDRSTGVAFDGSGNVYSIGTFAGSATFGDAPSAVTLASTSLVDNFAAGYTAGGAIRWATDFGSGTATSATGARPIAVGGGGIFVTGGFGRTAKLGGTSVYGLNPDSQNSFVIRLDSTSGSLSWIRLLRGSTDAANAFGVQPVWSTTGTLFLTGSTVGTIVYGPPGSAGTTFTDSSDHRDLLVLRVFSNGGFGWRHLYPSTGYVNVGGAVAGPAGGVNIAGTFDGTLTLDTTGYPSRGNYDGFVAQWDATGTLVRASTFGGSGVSGDLGMDLAGSGDTPVLGAFFGQGNDTLVGGSTTDVGPSGLIVTEVLHPL